MVLQNRLETVIFRLYYHFVGTSVNVTLRCSNSYRHQLMMKFGKDITIRDDAANEAIAHVTVTDNEGFYQWLASCGSNVILEAPEEMRTRYREYLQNALAYYRK